MPITDVKPLVDPREEASYLAMDERVIHEGVLEFCRTCFGDDASAAASDTAVLKPSACVR